MKKKIGFVLIGLVFIVAISAVTYHRAGAGATEQSMQGGRQEAVKYCTQGRTFCPGGCTNLKSDNYNCGECGIVCPTGAPCTNGACLNHHTRLLFSYATNSNGFDTGIAISNTAKDPFGTPQETGVCTLYFYGSSDSEYTTQTIAPGTQFSSVVSLMAPGFSGYIIADCNFRNAHGWAMVSDLGARNFAASVPAQVLVVPRPPAESLGE